MLTSNKSTVDQKPDNVKSQLKRMLYVVGIIYRILTVQEAGERKIIRKRKYMYSTVLFY